MAVSITEIMTVMQNAVEAIHGLTTQIANTFPQASATSTTAPSTGTITFNSSQAKAFLTVVTSSGATYVTPLY